MLRCLLLGLAWLAIANAAIRDLSAFARVSSPNTCVDDGTSTNNLVYCETNSAQCIQQRTCSQPCRWGDAKPSVTDVLAQATLPNGTRVSP